MVLWRVSLRDHRILWSRTTSTGGSDGYSYDRIIWSEALQTAAISFAGATDGESFRQLVLVGRAGIVRSKPPRDEWPTDLLSDPVWLGSKVVFAEGRWDHVEAPNRKRTNVLSSFDARTKKHRILFSGADGYSAPAVSPDRTRLAYAQAKGDAWEVVVVAVK
jgi:hypothetical protein